MPIEKLLTELISALNANTAALGGNIEAGKRPKLKPAKEKSEPTPEPDPVPADKTMTKANVLSALRGAMLAERTRRQAAGEDDAQAACKVTVMAVLTDAGNGATRADQVKDDDMVAVVTALNNHAR